MSFRVTVGLFLAVTLASASQARAQTSCGPADPVVGSAVYDGRPVPADLAGFCMGAGGQCPVLQWRGFQYWAFSYRDNRVAMAIVAYNSSRQQIARFDRPGARYNSQIALACAYGRAQFVGQSGTITVPWSELAVKTTITATASGGTVSGGGLDCGTTCSAQVPVNVPTTFTATPASGLAFIGWTGACAGQGATCTVTPSLTPASIGATFGVPVAVTSPAGGTITGAGLNCGATCNTIVAPGTALTFTATPAAGLQFTGWTGACAGQTTTQCTVTPASTALTIGAGFQAPVTAAAPSGGTITGGGLDCGSNCSTTVAAGSSLTFTATPAGGKTFIGWGGACTGSNPSCTVTANGAVSVSATFGVTVTVNPHPKGKVTGIGLDCGTTCSVVVPVGVPVTITRVPASGYVLGYWINGVCQGQGANCTFTPTTNTTINLDFYTQVSVTMPQGGFVTSFPISCGFAGGVALGSCSTSMRIGTTVTLSADGAGVTHLSSWGGACAFAGSNPQCTLTVDQSVNVSATFVR